MSQRQNQIQTEVQQEKPHEVQSSLLKSGGGSMHNTQRMQSTTH